MEPIKRLHHSDARSHFLCSEYGFIKKEVTLKNVTVYVAEILQQETVRIGEVVPLAGQSPQRDAHPPPHDTLLEHSESSCVVKRQPSLTRKLVSVGESSVSAFL